MKAKLSDLLDALDFSSEELTYYLDRKTGEILLVTSDDIYAFENESDDEDLPDWQSQSLSKVRPILEEREPERYIGLPTQFDFHEYRHMERFIWGLENERHREQLERAIRGRGAFRYFKHKIHELGISEKWFRYRDVAMKRFILDWCEVEGIPVLDDKPSKK